MYIARTLSQGKQWFVLRESYQSGPWISSRDIIDLGTDLDPYIVYSGRQSFYIHEDLDEKLRSLGFCLKPGEIEDVFWPYVHPKIQSHLTHTHRHRRGLSRPGAQFTPTLPSQVHTFDRRRFLFLKTGQSDLSQVDRLPSKYFQKMANQSRDELEHHFLCQEWDLKENELKKYVFSIFNLYEAFSRSQLFGGDHSLNEEDVDRAFLKSFCMLSSDPLFFMTPQPEKTLLEHLDRYLFFFFDNEFPEVRLGSRGRSRTAHHPKNFPSRATRASDEQIFRLFGLGKNAVQNLSRTELIRIYRQRALVLHPDKGGDHELFILLTTLYRTLLKGGKI